MLPFGHTKNLIISCPCPAIKDFFAKFQKYCQNPKNYWCPAIGRGLAGASMAGIGDKPLFDKELKLDRQTTEGG